MSGIIMRHIFKRCTGCSSCQEQIPFNNLNNGQASNNSNKPKRKLIGIIALTLLITVVIVTVVLITDEMAVGCDINPLELDSNLLVVYAGTEEFIYPDFGETVLKFPPGVYLDFICPGRTIIVAKSKTNHSLVSGSCSTKTIFRIGNADIDWKDLRCSDSPLTTFRYNGISCGNNSKEIEAGFEVGNDRFLKSLLICFNQVLQIAHYTFIALPHSINHRVWNTPRPSFKQGEFYNIGTVDKLYLRKKQRTTINRLLGLPDNSTKYIQDNNNYFLSRGHMTANGDNFYAAQQNATFFFPNVAPQWQTFNGYNWNQIEIDIRDYAESNAVDLLVWTGVHGVATLPHEKTGKPTELYLFVDTTTNRTALPVPEIYWKIAFDPVTEHGIALIGVNNPYNNNFTMICQDVSQKLKWLRCNRDDQQRGFCYACSVEAFKKIVPNLPILIDRGLLL